MCTEYTIGFVRNNVLVDKENSEISKNSVNSINGEKRLDSNKNNAKKMTKKRETYYLFN